MQSFRTPFADTQSWSCRKPRLNPRHRANMFRNMYKCENGWSSFSVSFMVVALKLTELIQINDFPQYLTCHCTGLMSSWAIVFFALSLRLHHLCQIQNLNILGKWWKSAARTSFTVQVHEDRTQLLCQGHTRQTVVFHLAYVCLSWLMVICQSRPHYISENQTSACQTKM